MNQSCYTRLTLIMWLILMSVSFSPGAFAQKREIKTLDELLEVLRPMAYQTKSDSVGIVGDVLIAEDGISVDRSIPVAVKASLKGGPLYRAADYEGAILDIGPDGDLTLANTIAGLKLNNAFGRNLACSADRATLLYLNNSCAARR